KANPTAMFLSAAMMLHWLGDRRGVPAAREAGAMIETAVAGAFRNGRLRPVEMGGQHGTSEITAAVLAAMAQ
ncbi:MAG: isocitrate/isopropylmalate dehydrogenase family protein, partial [Hyphomicrobiaceae bacterium]